MDNEIAPLKNIDGSYKNKVRLGIFLCQVLALNK